MRACAHGLLSANRPCIGRLHVAHVCCLTHCAGARERSCRGSHAPDGGKRYLGTLADCSRVARSSAMPWSSRQVCNVRCTCLRVCTMLTRPLPGQVRRQRRPLRLHWRRGCRATVCAVWKTLDATCRDLSRQQRLFWTCWQTLPARSPWCCTRVCKLRVVARAPEAAKRAAGVAAAMGNSDKRVWEAVDGHPGIFKAFCKRGETYRVHRMTSPGRVLFRSRFASLEGAAHANRKCVGRLQRGFCGLFS
jgi:hypothetical protein